jgi:hypothetical protein
MITITANGVQKALVPRTAFDDVAIEILKEFEVAEHISLKTAGEIAHELSSGSATEQMLGTAVNAGGYGHPYGHGPVGALGPRGEIPNQGDPAVINIQTGEFAEGWHELTGWWKIDILENSLVNETEHAKLLEETPDELQVARPIVARVEELLTPIREINLNNALQEINRI